MAAKKPLPEEANRIILVSNIRWTALSSIVAIIFMTLSVGLKFAVLPIMYVALIFSLYNFILILLARNNPDICRNPLFIYAQFLFDLCVVTALVHFTGGLESPFVFLYLLFPTVVAIFYGSSFAIFMAGHAVILFAGINQLESFGFITHYMIAIPPIVLYRDVRFLFLHVVSFFFICLALIYSVSYLADMFRKKQKEIEEISAEKMDFMNNVAHELRSPLTSIKEYISLFAEGLLGDVPPNQKDVLGVLDRQAKRMVTMISDLLDIARIESGKAKFEQKQVNLTQVIDNAATELVPQFVAKKLKLVQAVDPNLPLVQIDELKILEILINLLSNAIKFSRDSGKIYIATGLDPKFVTVSVRDEGHGIEKQDLPHIFEKFYRAQKESASLKGTGLGLSLCKSIIERHGGKIWAKSPGLDKGATFYFSIPLK